LTVMKYRLILLSSLLILLFSDCKTPTRFKSDVKTVKKPWTNLNFYNDPKNFQFGIISDRTGGNRPGVFEDGVKKLNMMMPEFVMCVGDLITGYTTDTAVIKKDWATVNGVISGLKMPFFYLPGNHDITNKTMAAEWEKLYGRRYYSFVYKNTLFISLDTNDDENYNLTTEQTDFVINALKKNSDVRWTFIFMHHPIWKYKTNGRFDKIEQELASRKHTVIAGHEHNYNYSKRNNSNYYILSTTGGSSALRGTYIGEFDHISWVTMTDEGPIIANLRLDGILAHDISNEKTAKMAKPLLENTMFKNLVLCNKGELLTHGTLYLTFKNPSDTPLDIKLNFLHHHQLQIENPEIAIQLSAGASQSIEIPFHAIKPITKGTSDLLQFFWEMKYTGPDYPGFSLQGKHQIEVSPTIPTLINHSSPLFIDQTTIELAHPFSNKLSMIAKTNNQEAPYLKPIELKESSNVSGYLKNDKEEYSAVESENFEKTDFQKATQVNNLTTGLNYSYFEGEWNTIPDFTGLVAKTKGVATNFAVQDLAQREDHWGVLYTGFIKIPEDGFYQFMSKADDACRITIDNRVVVTDHGSPKGTETGTAALQQGFHNLKIEYLEKVGPQRLRLYLKKGDAEDWDPLKSELLFH